MGSSTRGEWLVCPTSHMDVRYGIVKHSCLTSKKYDNLRGHRKVGGTDYIKFCLIHDRGTPGT